MMEFDLPPEGASSLHTIVRSVLIWPSAIKATANLSGHTEYPENWCLGKWTETMSQSEVHTFLGLEIGFSTESAYLGFMKSYV